MILDKNIEFILKDYILQSAQPIDTLRKVYPNLNFEEVASEVIHVEVPEGAEDEFKSLMNTNAFLSIPELFGLNAREALIEANILMFHDYPFGELRGSGVMIGFVDTGIDYTHTVFKNEDHTTRILRIWDQTVSGKAPTGFTYGSEYTKEEIDEALKASNPYELVPSKDDIGHGTFMAGLAAGDDKTQNNEYVGGAPDADLLMVKLRPAKNGLKEYYLVREEAIAYQENDILAGIRYLFKMATELKKPLIICIGIGNNEGEHQGTSRVELYLNSRSRVQNLIMVIAAGNEANSGHHFRGNITTGGKQDIEINVEEGEKGFFVSLWALQGDKFAVSIRSPLGQEIEKVPVIPSEVSQHTFNLERTVVTVGYDYPNAQAGAENIVIRFKTPTPGIWSISVYGEEVTRGSYNIWLPRNDFILQGTRFLKSDALVTICNPCTGEKMIAIGAYDYIDESVYVASGRGFRPDEKIKPELIAPGVNVEGPQIGGGYTTYVGTSTAAAIMASAAALFMQWASIEGNLKEVNTRIARGIFIRGASRRRGVIYPSTAEGYGKLDLRNTIASI